MGSIETTVPHSIPTVDIRAFLANDASAEAGHVVEAMRHACSEYGFFYLVGHGISEVDRQKILDCARLFSSLSEEQKMDVWIGKCMGRSFRGFEPPALQLHQEGLLADTKEVTFIFGREVPADAPEAGTFSTGPNLWPKSLPDDDFRIPLMDYHGKMLELVAVLLKNLARGLPQAWNCSPNVFDELNVKPSAPMRLLHYKPQAVKKRSIWRYELSLFSLPLLSLYLSAFPSLCVSIAIPEAPSSSLYLTSAVVDDHTDFGNVSVLLQEEGTEGLEVWYPPTETWIPVPVKPHSYVINMGDMMQKWTAGYYRSARHRVVNHSTKPRYSAPFFLNGNLVCRALDGSGVETTVGEHVRQRLVETIGGEAGKKLSS